MLLDAGVAPDRLGVLYQVWTSVAAVCGCAGLLFPAPNDMRGLGAGALGSALRHTLAPSFERDSRPWWAKLYEILGDVRCGDVSRERPGSHLLLLSAGASFQPGLVMSRLGAEALGGLPALRVC